MAALTLPRENTRHPAHEASLKMLLAGTANAIGSCVTNPADLVKVRQQLYVKSGSEKFSPSFIKTLVRMIRSEGPLSIFKGLSASMTREMSYSGIRMGLYDICKTTIHSISPSTDSNSLLVKLLAGMTSGCLGAAVANPADLIKVRMQAAGATLSLRGHALAIVQERGLKGLYRGVLPTTFRAGILTSSQLGSYDWTKTYLKREYPKQFPESLRTHFICSGIAGFVCSVASAPVDTIKVRVMNDAQKKYKNALHATAMLLRYEGPAALLEANMKQIVRSGPDNAEKPVQGPPSPYTTTRRAHRQAASIRCMPTDSLFSSDDDGSEVESSDKQHEHHHHPSNVALDQAGSPGDHPVLATLDLAPSWIQGLHVFRDLLPLELQETLLRSILLEGIVTREHPQAMLFPRSASNEGSGGLGGPSSSDGGQSRDLATCPSFLRPTLEVLSGLLRGKLSHKDHQIVFDQTLALQTIVNLYEPGQGISPHVDLPHRYAEPIVGISLAASTVMDLYRDSDDAEDVSDVGGLSRTQVVQPACSILLRPGDVYVMLGAARYEYKHGIAYRHMDVYRDERGERQSLYRGTRVSITLRRMLPESQQLVRPA